MNRDGSLMSYTQLESRSDPLAFTLDALSARGGLVESQLDTAVAVLPTAVARELKLPEECLLTAASEGVGTINCGLGTALLDRLIEEARSAFHVAHVSLDVTAPRPTRARSLAEAFAVRNGVTQFLEVLPGTTEYLFVAANWIAQADDSFEGIVQACVESTTGSQPDIGFESLVASAVSGAQAARDRSNPQSFASQESNVTGQRLAALLESRASKAAAPVRAGVIRRHAREYRQITEYYAAMCAEVKKPRRKLDEQTLAARLSAVLSDRDSKLRDLDQRFRLRIALTPIALVAVTVPSVTARLQVRRRQAERVLSLRLPAEAQNLDSLACEGCLGFTHRPAVCDARLHLLCESCIPEAKGRFTCPACT